MSRYAGPVRLRLNGPDARDHVDRGRKLLGELETRPEVSSLTKRLADGTVLTAARQGGQRQIAINTPPKEGGGGEAIEEIIYCYISSPDGLRIFDLGRKAHVRTLSGLDDYKVAEASRNGKVVYMTGGISVRVNLSDDTAFGYGYTVDVAGSSPPDGLAYIDGLRLSPSGDRLLAQFALTTDPEGLVLEGIPGVILIDEETLEPLRPAIRMSRRDTQAIWAPQGDRFCINVSIATDAGDVSNPGVYTSTADYLAVFDADGTLLGTRQLSTWSFTPDAGFSSLIKAVGLSGTHAFVAYEEDFIAGYKLSMIDYRDAALPIVATVTLPVHPSQRPRCICVSYGGAKIAVWYAEGGGNDARVLEYAISESSMALIHDTGDPSFTTGAWSGGATEHSLDYIIRRGPRSQFSQPPDPRRWFLLEQAAVSLHAYRAFDQEPVYDFDFLEMSVGDRYALASAGSRRFETR